MEVDFDHQGKQVSKEWLTSVLKEGGFLTSGEVIGLEQKQSRFGTTITSEFFELAIKYSSNSTGSHPSNCLLKVGKPERFEITKKEAKFYDLIASTEKSESLLESYGTSINKEAKSAIILLEDKSDDELKSTEWPVPPEIDECELAVKSLAQVHAKWWESPVLGNEGFERISEESIDSIFSQLNSGLAPFFEQVGDGLSQPRRVLLEKLLERYPAALKQRVRETSTQTLIHGDAHFWNFLFPKDESKHPILIDWQSWQIGFGTSDLAYMIGLHWFPERRVRFEKRLLNTYLEELHRHEINYGYDDLWHDYRLRVAIQPVIPMLQAQFNIPASVWWPHLDRAFSAFNDLKCAEFLE